MFVVPIQTYILIYKKIYEHWGVAGTLVPTLGLLYVMLLFIIHQMKSHFLSVAQYSS